MIKNSSGGWIRTNDLRVMSGTSSFFTLSCHSVIYSFCALHAGRYFGQHVEHVQHVERKFSYILATLGDAMQMPSLKRNVAFDGSSPCRPEILSMCLSVECICSLFFKKPK